MQIKRIMTALALAGMLGGPTAALAACAPADQSASPDQVEVEDSGFDTDEDEDCDLDDQREGDRDCGYYSSPGVWSWYPWVILHRTTTPPAGWHRPYSYSRTKPGVNTPKTGTKTRSTTGSKPGSSGTKAGSTGGGSKTTGGKTTTGGGTRSSGGGGRR
ncbi:hypothetical protein [Micromonospora maritima]|uniref:hypothetical protein n=1 Tax=Micromonospora maritima TaxID=986711 RepID=UPI00157E236B|nr:hypothetical protein [Micromonospora maritima]